MAAHNSHTVPTSSPLRPCRHAALRCRAVDAHTCLMASLNCTTGIQVSVNFSFDGDAFTHISQCV
eukprot:6183308-Pleurochrysis_carterae.AAC.2